MSSPFADVRVTRTGFSIPTLKWRELLFVGALRRDGSRYVRDPSRPLPPFEIPGLFPDGAVFRARTWRGRVLLRRERPENAAVGPGERRSHGRVV